MKTQELREEIKSLISGDKYSIAGISRAVDLSSSAVSQWLNDKYTGNKEKVETALRAWLVTERERKALGSRGMTFVETENAKRIFSIAGICAVEGDVGVVYGPAGLGKTISAQKYALDNPGCIYIEVDPSFSALSLVKEIHSRLGGDGKGGLFDIFKDVLHRLNGTSRLIIVDQAEILPVKGIELLRSINDKTGCGILLLGMDQLRNNIRGVRGQFAQLSSRIGVSIRLKELKDEEIQLLVQAKLPGSNGQWRHFRDATRNPRSLSKLIKLSDRVARQNEREVDAEIIQQTKTLLEV